MDNKRYYICSIASIASVVLFTIFATIFYMATLVLVPYHWGPTALMLGFVFLVISSITSIVTVICNKKQSINMKGFLDKKGKRAVIISFVVIVIMYILFIAMTNYFYCYGEVDGEQLYYHMLVSASGMDFSAVKMIALPSVIGGVLFTGILFYIYYAIICMLQVKPEKDMSKTSKIFSKTSVITSIIATCLAVVYLFNIIPIMSFVSYQLGEPSTFIEEHYADPKTTNIQFPEQKRNLIFIYMESMENTFTDKENGGGFGINMIPEIVNLQNSNISFSNGEKAGGAVETYGMTYTTAGIVSTTFGLPLKVGSNSVMANTDAIMPNTYNLFDVLNDAGYNQYVVMGSSAEFGGLKQLFDSHGNTTIYDYDYMIESGYIPKDYRVFWGVEDIKMYDYSMKTITEASKRDEPFVVVMETVDTHSPDGWVCEKCKNEFTYQYSNVVACASRQLDEFVKWAQSQEWYDNTTIVVVGDHLSMKNEFFISLDADYVRTTTNLIINPDPSLTYDETVLKNREFCSMDIFPTTLAAIGCKIDGDRLGLGTNLFSGTKTLFEELGFEKVNTEFKKKSTFYENVFN